MPAKFRPRWSLPRVLPLAEVARGTGAGQDAATLLATVGPWPFLLLSEQDLGSLLVGIMRESGLRSSSGGEAQKLLGTLYFFFLDRDDDF
jgi:hypothetical protein